MKTRHWLLAAALAGAAALALFGDRSADDSIAEPVARIRSGQAPATAHADRAEHRDRAEAILPLQSRATLYGTDGGKAAATLFAGRDWTPPAPLGRAAAKPPPSIPPLPFVYLGKKIEDDSWEVYLGRGEQSLIVREQSVIDGTWRVDAIKPPTMTITYLPLKQAQPLIIGGTD